MAVIRSEKNKRFGAWLKKQKPVFSTGFAKKLFRLMPVLSV
jgi:hypothetical protein